MRRLFQALFCLMVPIAAPSWAWAGSDEKGADENRCLPEKWRGDPDHFARLCRDLNSFLALSAQRQEQLRRLDHDLHDQASTGQARLRRVLERYVDWLQRLPEKDRLHIETAPNDQERLRIVRELREKDWIARLPQATQAELRRLPADQRPLRIAELHKQEREFKRDWQTATRHWDELMTNRPEMTRLSELGPELKSFVTDSLSPMLNEAEKKRLRDAQDKWPLFPQTLVELADKHPIRLPPGKKIGPVRYSELPTEVQRRFPGLKSEPSALAIQAEGKWPDYAFAVVQYARSNGLQVGRPLGPCRPGEFITTVEVFLDKKLRPALSESEKAELSRRVGRWPGYPMYIMQMSRKYKLEIPGMKLPGNAEFWGRFRGQKTAGVADLPDVPDLTLLDFAHTELNPDVQNNPPLDSALDPNMRMKLKQAYFQAFPAELQRLRVTSQRREKPSAPVK